MLGLLSRLLSGAVTPLTDQLTDFGARLLRKLAFFFVAAVCLVVVLIALTIAFDLWVSKLADPIAGALSVAGVYFVAALLAVWLALRRDRPTATAKPTDAEAAAAKAEAALGDRVDAFTAPLLATLQRLGLRREQLAVLAGASVAKQLGPLPLVGLAILAGFLIGRMATSWRSLIPLDLISDVWSSGLFGFGAASADPDPDDAG